MRGKVAKAIKRIAKDKTKNLPELTDILNSKLKKNWKQIQGKSRVFIETKKP